MREPFDRALLLRNLWARLPDALPFIFFAILFLLTVKDPPLEAFDEFHYVGAAKELIQFESNRNWEHPPLAKLIMGASWKVFTVELDWFDELVAMRLAVILFGLGVLVLFRQWCLRLEFGAATTRALVWTVGFNMCWFVQSKTAMLDMFALFFGLAGMLATASAAPRKSVLAAGGAGALLGLAMASKWNALPFLILSLWFARKASVKNWGGAVAGLFMAYTLALSPLGFVERGAVPLHYMPEYQVRMLSGLQSTSERVHSYRSSAWQWITLNRPMWYTFSKVAGSEPVQHHCVFMGGNPFIFWPGFIAMLVLVGAWLRHRRTWPDRREALVFAFYAVPLLIWLPSPRKLMFFYYVIPASLWYGPAIALALRKFLPTPVADRVLWGVVIASGAFFFFMLPLLTGQALPYDAFRTLYQPWMYPLNWI
jgi:dolichyl-phosphate-mannose--protein O-mannosyl transferase